jgi:hypothetical protein
MRNLLSVVPKAALERVAAIIRIVLPTPTRPRLPHGPAVGLWLSCTSPGFPQAADLLEDAAEDLLATCTFSRAAAASSLGGRPRNFAQGDQEAHECGGDLSQPSSLVQTVATLLLEQDDEWQVAEPR